MSNQNTPTPAFTYNERIQAATKHLGKLQKRQDIMPVLRLLSFGALILVISIGVTMQVSWAFLALLPVVGLYIRLGIVDAKIKQQIAENELIVRINQNELAYLKGDLTPFDAGLQFLDHSHNYAHDLDVFGDYSIYRALNRTSSPGGSQILANWLSDAFLYRHEIEQRQEAFIELAPMVDFRQQCQLIFGETKPLESDLEKLKKWLETPSDNTLLVKLKPFLYAFPLITILSIAASAVGWLPITLPAFCIALQLTFVMRFGRKIMIEHQSIGSQYSILKKYAGFLELLLNTDLRSKWIKQQKESLYGAKSQNPALVLRQLAALLNWMDSNLNFLVALLLNGLLMFNLHLLLRLSHWKRLHASQIPKWFICMANVDAALSLANYTYNHPNFNFPTCKTDGFKLEAIDLGHPLIPENECITNTVQITGTNQFCIITGANMSGKSTFLRTVGTNLVMAMIGAPVFASSFVFQPIAIASSIRTNDSLARHESYFYAELKRLKEIIDELAKGEPLLILLDEILKGTNSRDKQNGSIALIKQLMKYKPIGLFATHDLDLGNLIKTYPNNIQNLCFEISITGNQLLIDYKLRKGVCSTLNASYLMRQMGITDE
jgi:hypothetical protein